MSFPGKRLKLLKKTFSSQLGIEPHGGDLNSSPKPAYPLPLSLKELCLLAMINDIDSFPLELLASQPHWLRYRLLNNLPAIDLCRLDSTPVANGVDINEVWKRKCVEEPDYGTKAVLARWGAPDPRRALFKEVFQINVQGILPNRSYHSNLEKEMKSVFDGIKKQHHGAHKEKYLFEIVSNVLSHSSESALKTIAHKLVSIRGDLLLHDLDAKPRQLSDGQTIWNVQGNSLLVSTCKHKLGSAIAYPVHTNNEDVQLTPHRLLPIRDNIIRDQFELLLALMRTSNLKPSCVNFDIGPGAISPEVRKSLVTRQIVGDNNLSYSSSYDFTSILKRFLESVTILRLQSQNYAYIGILISLLHAATVKGNDSQFKALFCCLSNIYSETVQPFTALFSLQNFQLLHLQLKETANPQTLTKLLQGFLTAPCSHPQRLVIDMVGTVTMSEQAQLPSILNESRLSSLNMHMGGAIVPDCAVQHKIICSDSLDYILQFILLLPTVRLNELALNSRNHSGVHLCACHPDLQIAKLSVYLYTPASAKGNHVVLATIKDDLISLLNKPNLQEVSFSGKWEGCQEAKLGVQLGLDKHPRLLKKIVLDMYGYSEEELRELWTTLDTLKRSYGLEVVLGKCFIDMLKKSAGKLYKSWMQLVFMQPQTRK